MMATDFYYAFVQEVNLIDFSSNYELNHGPALPYIAISKLQKDTNSNFLILKTMVDSNNFDYKSSRSSVLKISNLGVIQWQSTLAYGT